MPQRHEKAIVVNLLVLGYGTEIVVALQVPDTVGTKEWRANDGKKNKYTQKQQVGRKMQGQK